jgi:Zn-dependent protease
MRLDLGNPPNHCYYLSRGGTRLRRSFFRRQYRLAARPRDPQPIQTHRSGWNHFVARSAICDSISVSLRICQASTSQLWVAAAGPGMNIGLAVLAALSFHVVSYFPDTVGRWIAENLKNALVINVFLAIFNMLPLPPLDGGRVAVGLLPDRLAIPLARLEPYGLALLIGVLFILPILGAQFGIDLSVVSRFVAGATYAVISAILVLTGNT